MARCRTGFHRRAGGGTRSRRARAHGARRAIYEGELVDHDPAAEFGGHDPDDDLVAGYADGGFDGDGDGFGDGAGAGVPDEEPIEVPEGRLTVRDIMLRLEWEKREALGPGTGDTR